ncbi:MAG TPA: PhoU domain-containing protein [Proteobacteria bacterium]|nr:PhoU domain-containing protein [Pseudomonadota bacterium]
MSSSGRNKNQSSLRVLDDNFRLLLSEGVNQLARTFAYIESFSEALHGKIIERDDYIDNLKLTIENQCFTTLSQLGSEEKEKIAHLRARQIICVNLERIADCCINISKQVDFLSNREFWWSFSPQPMSLFIEKSLNLVDQALTENDIAKAMLICRSECELDELFT